MESVFKSVDERSARMRSDSVKNMSAYADQNHAPSLTDVRLELSDRLFLKLENGHDNPGSLSYHDRSIL